MRPALLFIFLFLSISRSYTQEPSLSARVDSSSYTIGEWIHLHVDGKCSVSVITLRPAVKDSLGPFEILAIDTVKPESADDGRRFSWTFRLTTFDSGKVFVPPISFHYQLSGDTTQRLASTNPVFLSIAGVTIDPKGDIKDIKPPLDAPWKFADILPYLVALVLILAGALGYLYYRRKRKRREEALVPPKPKIPPGEAALVALHLVEEKRLWQQGHVKAFYSEVTEIVRRFLEDEFGILALESTSDEVLQQLKTLSEAQVLLKQFRAFFTTADLVKFAKYQPAPDENENELRWAYEIVRTMMPRPTLVTQEAEEVIHVR